MMLGKSDPDELDLPHIPSPPPNKDQSDIPFCGCLSVRFYQPFFDIDTSGYLL